MLGEGHGLSYGMIKIAYRITINEHRLVALGLAMFYVYSRVVGYAIGCGNVEEEHRIINFGYVIIECYILCF